MYVPHYFQEEAEASIYNYFAQVPHSTAPRNPVVAMPTGTGKSIVIGSFIKNVYRRWPTQRILMLTHVQELIEQNHAKLMRMWPSAPAGIFSAGLKRKEIAPITYGGIGSVYRSSQLFGHIDIVKIDECHLVSEKEGSMYLTLLSQLREINPYLKVIGYSATPYRIGSGKITEGGIFTDICYDITGREAFNRLIREGYLCQLVPRPMETQIDTSQVQIHAGEFVASQLQSASNKREITIGAIKETLAIGRDRRSWLFFTTGIDHTEETARILNDEFGIPTRPIHSKISDDNRRDWIRAYKAGRLRCLVNNNVLTTGFDHPELDLIAVLRPTNSPVLWVQMLGRGTRVAEGKRDCLVLDFARNTPRLGPINDPVIPKRRGSSGKESGTAPIRICVECGVYNHASATHCINCGTEFPRIVKFGTQAGQDKLIVPDKEPPVLQDFKVDRVTYQAHKKSDRPDSLKVSYFCGFRMFQKYVCIEHSGHARNMARHWWKRHTGDAPMPDTVMQALARVMEIRTPVNIRVHINNQPEPQVLNYDFTGTEFTEAGGNVPGAPANH